MRERPLIRVAVLPEDLRQFNLAGRVLVWSLRHWVFSKRKCERVPTCVWSTLERVWQANDLRNEATTLWSRMHAGARKTILIRAPLDHELTTDERMIVAALSAARAQLPELGRWFLADLLQANALDETCRSFAHLGARLRELPCGDAHDGFTIGLGESGDGAVSNADATARVSQ